MKLFLPVALILLLLGSSLAQASSNNGGWYQGGVGSSHKGGKYRNPSTGDHYQHHR